MSLTSAIEEKLKIDITKLTPDEKQTYFKMLESVRESQLTPERLREYIISMRDAVERELVKEPEYQTILCFKIRNDRNITLKARLYNYMLLESFLISPDKAQKQMDDMIKGLTERK